MLNTNRMIILYYRFNHRILSCSCCGFQIYNFTAPCQCNCGQKINSERLKNHTWALFSFCRKLIANKQILWFVDSRRSSANIMHVIFLSCVWNFILVRVMVDPEPIMGTLHYIHYLFIYYYMYSIYIYIYISTELSISLSSAAWSVLLNGNRTE